MSQFSPDRKMRRDDVEDEGWYRGGDDWGSRDRDGNRFLMIIVTKKTQFFHKNIFLIQC